MKRILVKSVSLISTLMLTGILLCAQVSWNPINCVFDGDIKELAISPDNHIYAFNIESVIIGNLQSNLYMSADNGDSWKTIDTFNNTYIRGILIASPEDIYIASGEYFAGVELGIWHSKDDGETWKQILDDEGYGSGGSCGHMFGIAKNSLGTLVTYDDTEGIFQLTAEGEEWQKIAIGDNFQGGDQTVRLSFEDLVIFTGDYGDHYYLGTSRGVYVSKNYGITWRHLGLGRGVNCMDLDGTQGLIVGTSGNGVYRYSIVNDKWTYIGLSGTILSLTCQQNSTIYAATQFNGFAYTEDNGKTWNQINGELDNASIFSLTKDKNGGLYAGTDVGIYHLEAITGIRESQNTGVVIYPNPTYGQINIETEYSGPKSVEISAINGQSIFSKELSGRVQQIELAACPKGVYFITIRSKELITTRKIIKL